MELDDLADAGAILDALEGVAYVVAPDLTLVACSSRRWSRFAAANEAPELADLSNVLGRPLLEFIAGTTVRESHRLAAEAVLAGREEAVTYMHRCDAPNLRREMRLAITPLRVRGRVQGLLYHSILLREQARPPVGLLDRERRLGEAGPSLVTMCSYCHAVRHPPGGDAWIAPERYLEVGAPDEVWISHGICPECYEEIVRPLLRV